MVCDDQQSPLRGNARRAVVGFVPELQVPQRRVDEFESAQVPALVEEAVDRIEARPARHPAQQRRGNAAAVAAEPVRIALLTALLQSGPGKHWAARLSDACSERT